MTRRRVEALEVRDGVGRAAWEREAREGLRLCGEAAKRKDPEALPELRRVFADFRLSYRPGAGREDLEAALDRALDGVEAALSRDAFALALAFCVYGTEDPA